MRKLNVRFYIFIYTICFVLASFFIYYFSFESRVKILSCSGNHFFTDQQIYDMANVDLSSRTMFASQNAMIRRIMENPLIKEAEVKKYKDKISFHISEKVIIGYYIKDGKYYLVCNDTSRVELDSQYKDNLIHLPLIQGFSDTQINNICHEFKKYDKYLTQDIVEKISEIVPYKTSFDKNMLKITMQDGNFVYSRFEDLLMMARYESMLTDLEGNSVCLVLDAENSVIVKTSCEYMNMTEAERKKYHKDEDEYRKQYEEQSQPQLKEQQDLENQQEIEEQNELYFADDWEQNSFGYLYSPSLNLYKDPSTNEFYVWDDVLGLKKID